MVKRRVHHLSSLSIIVCLEGCKKSFGLAKFWKPFDGMDVDLYIVKIYFVIAVIAVTPVIHVTRVTHVIHVSPVFPVTHPNIAVVFVIFSKQLRWAWESHHGNHRHNQQPLQQWYDMMVMIHLYQLMKNDDFDVVVYGDMNDDGWWWKCKCWKWNDWNIEYW